MFYLCISIEYEANNELGHFIVEYEQYGEDRANYGEHLLEKISATLAQNGLKNVSVAELSRFRQFYTVYPQILGDNDNTKYAISKK
ncbi:hypothetical protein FACS189426_17840 [Bacteroidia bacterium]|nr:hypothetical protein FACS189426_17840 [Bacteroidia bacterium]GHV70257.1 hypothetical protein FACS189420_0610 [Bacteroidia bacterium]